MRSLSQVCLTLWILCLAAACGSSPPAVSDAGSTPAATPSNPGSSCVCSIDNNGVKKTLTCQSEGCINGQMFQCSAQGGITPGGSCNVSPSGPDGGPPPANPPADGGSTGQDAGPIVPAADWSQLDFGTTTDFASVAINLTDATPTVYVVGANGLCLASTGAGFQACGLPQTTAKLTTVSASLDSDVFVAADDGQIYYRVTFPGSPLVWSTVAKTPSQAVRASAWPTPSRAFVFGAHGLAGEFDPESMDAAFSSLSGIPATTTVYGASSTEGMSPDMLWAVGTGGTIARMDDVKTSTALTPEASGTGVTLHSVLALSDQGSLTEVIAVGEAGTILSRDTATGNWSPQPSGVTSDLYSVFLGIGGVYAAGAAGVTLYRADGKTQWTPLTSGVGVALRAGVLSVSNTGSQVFLVGDTGTVLVR